MVDWTDALMAEPTRARAYRYWDRLRGDQPQPRIGQLVPAELRSYAANSVLFELDAERLPVIRFLGSALADEAGMPRDRPAIATAADRTLLAALAARLPLIAASGAPLDFEAEQAGPDSAWTLYRGVLLPITDPEGRNAYVYGVVTWKRIHTVIDEDVRAVVDAVLTGPPGTLGPSPWAAARTDELPDERPAPRDAAQRIAVGRGWAALAAAGHVGHVLGLHAALCAGHDLALATLGCPAAARRAALEAVFGATSTGQYAEVLDRAALLGIGAGTLASVLDARGIDGFLRAAIAPEVVGDAYVRLSVIEPAASMPLEPGRLTAAG